MIELFWISKFSESFENLAATLDMYLIQLSWIPDIFNFSVNLALSCLNYFGYLSFRKLWKSCWRKLCEIVHNIKISENQVLKAAFQVRFWIFPIFFRVIPKQNKTEKKILFGFSPASFWSKRSEIERSKIFITKIHRTKF